MQVRVGRTVGGILCLLAGIAVFSVQDLILKLMSGNYPLHQAMVLRSLAALPVLTWLAHRNGGLGTLVTSGWRQMLGRGALNVCSYGAYYMAVAALPLAITVALFFTAPLMITALSILFLGERVTPARWVALLTGFAGVLIILRPGSAVFDWAAVLPLLAGLFYGAAQVWIRRLGARDTAAAMSFHSTLVFLVGATALSLVFGSGRFDSGAGGSLGFLMRGWVSPGGRDLLLMCLCGPIAAAGLTLLAQAYRMAEAHIVAPFEYSALFWALVWGWLFWQDWPDRMAWVGIAVLVAAGLFLLYGDEPPAEPEP